MKDLIKANNRLVMALLGAALAITLVFVLVLAFTPQLRTAIGTPAPTPGDDWHMYMHDVQRSSNSHEVLLSPATASRLTRAWKYQTGAGIAASPVIANGTVYVGSWDGYEYALDAATGYLKWKTFLGKTTARCNPAVVGVTSSAEVVNNVVYVGGGDSYWYALDAYTGTVLWRIFTGNNSADAGYYNWSSPLIYQGYAYIGIASNCDNPLVRGELMKVSLATHQIVGNTWMVAPGEVGGGIWTTPALDTTTNTLFVTTATQDQIWQKLPQAMVSIDLNTMQITGSWQIPLSQAGGDFDWGASPVLTTDAAGHKLVVSTNKNGFTYAFRRDDISAGPIWEQHTGTGGQCPICGEGDISSGAFANGVYYQADGNTSNIGGLGYPGAVRAVDPGTGNYIWERGVPNPILGAVAYANGLLNYGEGQMVEVLDAKTGARLYSYQTGNAIYGAPSVSHGQIFIGSLDGNVYSFGLGASTAPSADSHCLSNWSCEDIGAPKTNGSESFQNSSGSISGSGTGLANVSDQFRFVHQETNGNAQITASISVPASQPGKTRAGVMMRQSNDAGSPFYAVSTAANGSIVVQYRTAFKGAITTITPPGVGIRSHYLAIQRVADSFRAAISADGTHYVLLPGSTDEIIMPTKLLTGLFATSGISDTTARAQFAGAAIGGLSLTPAAPASAAPCPQSWQCTDIGNPLLVGDQTVANDNWTVTGSGWDIWLTNDQFHFIYQQFPADSTVSAQVLFQTKVDRLAKAGVMLRQSTDNNAVYYAAFETPGQGLTIQARNVPGLNATIVTQDVTITAPRYLRVARWNNIFTTYISSDGVQWTAVNGSSLTINVQGGMLGGIAIASHNFKASSTVNFAAVSTMQTADTAPTACVSGWQCADIGFASPHGTQLFNVAADSWTLEGGGFDIFGQQDQFHYVWQPMTGNVALSARIEFDNNGVDYAKAGLMLRASTDPGAPYYAVFLTPTHGVHVQYRATQGDNTGSIEPPGMVSGSIYLRIVRSGDTYTAYASNDGANWQAIDGSTITIPAMGNTLMTGLALTSHNSSYLRIATFDDINIG